MKKKLLILLDVILESCCYLVITYTLSSMYTSFKLHWFAVAFKAVDIFVAFKYYNCVKKTVGSNLVACIALVCCFLVFAFLSARIGYIHGELRHFSAPW